MITPPPSTLAFFATFSGMIHKNIEKTQIADCACLTHSIEMIPEDSRVEIDAKINAGYFTTGKKYTDEELKQVEGRGWKNWEDVTH